MSHPNLTQCAAPVALAFSPSLTQHHSRGSYGDAGATPRRNYGVVSMGVDPHGNHTGISPGRRRRYPGADGYEGRASASQIKVRI
jgi:hypothetical protein